MLVYIKERLDFQKTMIGRGVCADTDITAWGPGTKSWMGMVREDVLDGVIHTITDYIREHLPNRAVVPDDNELILYLWENRNAIKSKKHIRILANFTSILINTF
jgi:hypothetical protein|tara:strand:+ start:233 stop:544 length:312 start_codon:yes stop_codon:yes gene_type:complete